MSHGFRPFLHFLFHLGYLGPFVLGILRFFLPRASLRQRSSRRRPDRASPCRVFHLCLSAACGSTVGVILLSKVARKFGEDGIRKVAGQKQFDKLKKEDRRPLRSGRRHRVSRSSAFPFTMVIAAASALGYSLWRVAAINFVSRAVRFCCAWHVGDEVRHRDLTDRQIPGICLEHGGLHRPMPDGQRIFHLALGSAPRGPESVASKARDL